MNRQQRIENLAKVIYDDVWVKSDNNPGTDNWKCCIPEAESSLDHIDKEYAGLVELLSETKDWTFQQYAGAQYECLFCGGIRGKHDESDCFSLRAAEAIKPFQEEKS